MKNEKILLITGGSRGIGAATARVAATAGYHIVVNYRENQSEADRVVAEIVDNGGHAIALQGDVALESDIEHMFDEIDRRIGPVSALVNSAGVSGNGCAVADFSKDKLDHLFAVNVIGTMLCCRAAVRRMSTRHGGSGGAIVNVSSMAATIGGRAGASDYAASKAAVDAFTVGLAKEVGSAGIRVNALRPGMTLTDMTDRLRRDPQLLREMASTIAMNRIAEADEMAQPIVWLLSQQASFISGACLDASGGGFVIGRPLS
jgi:NAD(P)-dependent dehydrogenase (short-subunit alcohol dehydrogenase family)